MLAGVAVASSQNGTVGVTGRAAAPEALSAAPCLSVLVSEMGPWRHAAAARLPQDSPRVNHHPAVIFILFIYKNVCVFN